MHFETSSSRFKSFLLKREGFPRLRGAPHLWKSDWHSDQAQMQQTGKQRGLTLPIEWRHQFWKKRAILGNNTLKMANIFSTLSSHIQNLHFAQPLIRNVSYRFNIWFIQTSFAWIQFNTKFNIDVNIIFSRHIQFKRLFNYYFFGHIL